MVRAWPSIVAEESNRGVQVAVAALRCFTRRFAKRDDLKR
jgi:hypothetical protein